MLNFHLAWWKRSIVTLHWISNQVQGKLKKNIDFTCTWMDAKSQQRLNFFNKLRKTYTATWKFTLLSNSLFVLINSSHPLIHSPLTVDRWYGLAGSCTCQTKPKKIPTSTHQPDYKNMNYPVKQIALKTGV